MRSPEIYIAIGQSRILDNGYRVSIETEEIAPKQPENNVDPGSTAIHEAEHAVSAIKNGTAVVEANIIRSGNALGTTRLSHFDAAAAAAPHSHGRGGTGWDMSLVRSSGVSESAAVSAGRQLLSGAETEVFAVASLLQKKSSASGSEIKRAMYEAARPEEVVVFLTVKSPNGRIEKTQVSGGNEHETINFESSETGDETNLRIA